MNKQKDFRVNLDQQWKKQGLQNYEGDQVSPIQKVYVNDLFDFANSMQSSLFFNKNQARQQIQIQPKQASSNKRLQEIKQQIFQLKKQTNQLRNFRSQNLMPNKQLFPQEKEIEVKEESGSQVINCKESNIEVDEPSSSIVEFDQIEQKPDQSEFESYDNNSHQINKPSFSNFEDDEIQQESSLNKPEVINNLIDNLYEQKPEVINNRIKNYEQNETEIIENRIQKPQQSESDGIDNNSHQIKKPSLSNFGIYRIQNESSNIKQVEFEEESKEEVDIQNRNGNQQKQIQLTDSVKHQLFNLYKDGQKTNPQQDYDQFLKNKSLNQYWIEDNLKPKQQQQENDLQIKIKQKLVRENQMGNQNQQISNQQPQNNRLQFLSVSQLNQIKNNDVIQYYEKSNEVEKVIEQFTKVHNNFQNQNSDKFDPDTFQDINNIFQQFTELYKNRLLKKKQQQDHQIQPIFENQNNNANEEQINEAAKQIRQLFQYTESNSQYFANKYFCQSNGDINKIIDEIMEDSDQSKKH